MHLPGLIVGPRIVIGVISLIGSVRRDEHVDIALLSILHPYYICDRLCAQRFLRLRLIHLTTRLDMQIIRYVRREGVHPAGVTAVGLLQRILAAVAPVYGYRCTRHLLWCCITVQRQRARQGELIQSGSTYRAFNDEQFGILCRDISLEFLNTARQRNAYHEAC